MREGDARAVLVRRIEIGIILADAILRRAKESCASHPINAATRAEEASGASDADGAGIRREAAAGAHHEFFIVFNLRNKQIYKYGCKENT